MYVDIRILLVCVQTHYNLIHPPYAEALTSIPLTKHNTTVVHPLLPLNPSDCDYQIAAFAIIKKQRTSNHADVITLCKIIIKAKF